MCAPTRGSFGVRNFPAPAVEPACAMCTALQITSRGTRRGAGVTARWGARMDPATGWTGAAGRHAQQATAETAQGRGSQWPADVGRIPATRVRPHSHAQQNSAYTAVALSKQAAAAHSHKPAHTRPPAALAPKGWAALGIERDKLLARWGKRLPVLCCRALLDCRSGPSCWDVAQGSELGGVHTATAAPAVAAATAAVVAAAFTAAPAAAGASWRRPPFCGASCPPCSRTC